MNTFFRYLLTMLLVGMTAFVVAGPAAAQDPYERPDDSWISIDGTVVAVSPNTFLLDYGSGTITVEMDDGDRDADAYKLLPDDKVTVSGMIDADFFETRSIEASSVHVEKLGTTFYASSVDEEDAYIPFGYVTTPIVVSSTVMQGYVSSVDEHEFTLSTDARMVTVDVSDLPYDPLDDDGYQQVDVGDRVWVSGSVDYRLFEGQEFVADSIVILDNVEYMGD